MKQASQLVFLTLPPVSGFLVLQVTVKPAHLRPEETPTSLVPPSPGLAALVENFLPL